MLWGSVEGPCSCMQVSGCGSGLTFCRIKASVLYLYCMSLGDRINFRETGLQNLFQRHYLTMKCTLQ